MAWATEARVRGVGGFNDAGTLGDWKLFKFATNAELTAAIADAIAVASAFLKVRDPGGVYTTTDTDIQEILAQAESFLALHFFVPALKARRVYGTHYPLESEGSDRFEELIDIEWMELAQQLLAGIINLEVKGEKAFARPTLRVGRVIDPLDVSYKSSEQQIEETLDYARSLSVVLP